MFDIRRHRTDRRGRPAPRRGPPAVIISACRAPRLNVIIKLGALCLALSGAPARADDVRGVRAVNVAPLAERGGALLLSLTADQHGTRWPRTLRLLLDDGRAVEARVIWVERRDAPERVRWTADPRRMTVRDVRPDDDSSRVTPGSLEGPYLVARMPADVTGSFRLAGQTISPRWVTSPTDRTRPDPALPTLPAGPAPDLPDPHSPFEYWRWTLLADQMGVNPPVPGFTEAERIVADYYAALWTWALERLKRDDPALYLDCVAVLTRVARDRDKAFAAWEANPARLSELLGFLVDTRGDAARRLERIRVWLDQCQPLLFWIEAECPDHVQLAIINTTRREIVPRFVWIHTQDIPSAVPVEPGVLVHARIDRVSAPSAPLVVPGPRRTETHVLLVDYEQRQYRLDFPPPTIPAMPPAVALPPFNPPWTLGGLQTGQVLPMPADRRTNAQLRRLDGRWELFFECRRPEAAAPARVATAATLSTFRSYDEVRHLETVTVLIGAEGTDDEPVVALTVPETGEPRLFNGHDDGSLRVHRRSYVDRWYGRIVLPDSWLLPTHGPGTLIGALRSHADSDQVDSSPRAGVPWRVVPGRLSVDLSPWRDRPRFESDVGR